MLFDYKIIVVSDYLLLVEHKVYRTIVIDFK